MTQETNYYLADLNTAQTTVNEQIEGLLTHGATIQAQLVTQVATHEAWTCDEADTWVTDLNAQCNPVLTAFNSALDELDAEITYQSQYPRVDEGDWRGLAWRNQ